MCRRNSCTQKLKYDQLITSQLISYECKTDTARVAQIHTYQKMNIVKIILAVIFFPVYLIAADNDPSSDLIGKWNGMPQKNTTLSLQFDGNMNVIWIVDDTDTDVDVEAEYIIKKSDTMYLIKIHNFNKESHAHQIFKGIITFLDKDTIKMYGEYFRSEEGSTYPDEFGKDTVILNRNTNRNKSEK